MLRYLVNLTKNLTLNLELFLKTKTHNKLLKILLKSPFFSSVSVEKTLALLLKPCKKLQLPLESKSLKREKRVMFFMWLHQENMIAQKLLAESKLI